MAFWYIKGANGSVPVQNATDNTNKRGRMSNARTNKKPAEAAACPTNPESLQQPQNQVHPVDMANGLSHSINKAAVRLATLVEDLYAHIEKLAKENEDLKAQIAKVAKE